MVGGAVSLEAADSAGAAVANVVSGRAAWILPTQLFPVNNSAVTKVAAPIRLLMLSSFICFPAFPDFIVSRSWNKTKRIPSRRF